MQPHDSQEFLAAVLPSSGIYCVAELTSKKKEHLYVTAHEEITVAAELWDMSKRDVYFALACFREAGNRFAKNAVSMRSLFVDVDCGEKKAYPNKKAAAQALNEFLEVTKLGSLGSPWVVDSGGGLHVYWPLDADVPIAKWKPLAEAFKRSAKLHGFKIDMTCTADAARVLRVPGTTNRKYPKLVKIRAKGDTFNYDAIRECIGLVEEAQFEAAPTIAGAPPKTAKNASQIKLIENSEVSFNPIAHKCLQVRHYIQNAKDDGMEPLWRGILSLVKVCKSVDENAKKISGMHPYTMERTHQKLKEIKGPYPCTKLDSENPGVCEECPHWGKITNPLALGRITLTETAEKVIELPPETASETTAALAPAPATLLRPVAPKGFSYGQNGGIYREIVEEDENGAGKKKKSKLVLPYDLFVVDMLHVEGVHTVHLIALRSDGAKDVTVPSKALVSKDETVKALAEQNILASYGSLNDKNLFDYVRSAVEDANTRTNATTIPTQYGWQLDNSFVHNGKIYYADGTSRTTPMAGLENITSATKPMGTLENWCKVINMLVAKEMLDVVAHMSIGFGAPLMCFTGMRGLTFHAGHKESGTGKSLALSLVASVWGHPIDYRTGKSTSPVAMQQRAGNLNTLPFVCDELTMKARADAEWFPGFVFDFSEGRGKERMEARQNKERINTSTWSTLAMFTSNTRMLDYMTGVRQHSSEGELRRFLEWSPSKPLVFGPDEQKVIKSLQKNYGVAGEHYLKWLVANKDTAARVTQEVQERIFQDFNATNDERFWIAGVAAVVAGAVLAGQNYSGVIDLPVQAIIDCFKKMVQASRTAIRSNTVSAEDILNDYIREFYGQFVIVKKTIPGGQPFAQVGGLGPSGLDDMKWTRTKVLGRVEHDVSPGWVVMFIEEALLKRHCSLFSFGYADFKVEIANRFKVQYQRKDMLYGTKGPTMRINAMQLSMPLGEVQDELASQLTPFPQGNNPSSP